MIMKVEMTRHAQEDRIDRLTECLIKLGMNEIIRELNIHKGPGNNAIYSITDTGIVFVKSITTGKLITGYMMSTAQVIAFFDQVGERVPKALFQTVKNNCKRYPYLLDM